MEKLGHSGYSLSKELGTSEAVISNIRKGKNPPNIQLVQALLNKYEVVNASWLLTGKGSMFIGRTTATATDAEPEITDRLSRLERLVERSMVVQVERNMLADEAHSELEKQVLKLEKEVTRLKRVAHKNE